MKRREFSAVLATGALGAASMLGSARAQGGPPVEGKDYVKLGTPLPATSSGKIEVVEFFWYGCPHCSAFEPTLDAWSKKLPADVSFRRIPVAFRDEPYVAHQRIYFALDEMKLTDTMHRKVFAAIHVQGQRLDKEADIVALMSANGIDAAKFTEAFKSFSTQTKVKQGKSLSEAYKIDGVPALGVHGRFYTSGSLAGTNEKALAVADFLIQRSRSAT